MTPTGNFTIVLPFQTLRAGVPASRSLARLGGRNFAAKRSIGTSCRPPNRNCLCTIWSALLIPITKEDVKTIESDDGLPETLPEWDPGGWNHAHENQAQWR